MVFLIIYPKQAVRKCFYRPAGFIFLPSGVFVLIFLPLLGPVELYFFLRIKILVLVLVPVLCALVTDLDFWAGLVVESPCLYVCLS